MTSSQLFDIQAARTQNASLCLCTLALKKSRHALTTLPPSNAESSSAVLAPCSACDTVVAPIAGCVRTTLCTVTTQLRCCVGYLTDIPYRKDTDKSKHLGQCADLLQSICFCFSRFAKYWCCAQESV